MSARPAQSSLNLRLRAILTSMTPASEALLKRDPILRDLRGLTGTLLVFGGTFDPVHRGHIEIARRVSDATKASTVLFIPARINPLKSIGPVASDSQRLEMLSLALQPYPNWYLSTMELERVGASYTVDTLRFIKSGVIPETKLIFVFGADQLQNLHKWRNLEEIFKLAEVFVVGRDGTSTEAIAALTPNLSNTHQRLLMSNFIPLSEQVSASEIRAILASSERYRADALLPPGVFKYVMDNNLYIGASETPC